jgi:hypothetical protein
MTKSDKSVRVLTVLTPEVAGQVAKIAVDLRLSQSRTVALLVEAGLESLTNRAGRALAKGLIRVTECLEVVDLKAARVKA